MHKLEVNSTGKNLYRKSKNEMNQIDICIPRENYMRLKTQHGKVLHQLKVMETELVKLESEKFEMENELR